MFWLFYFDLSSNCCKTSIKNWHKKQEIHKSILCVLNTTYHYFIQWNSASPISNKICRELHRFVPTLLCLNERLPFNWKDSSHLPVSSWNFPFEMILPCISDSYEFFKSITFFTDSMWKYLLLLARLGTCIWYN